MNSPQIFNNRQDQHKASAIAECLWKTPAETRVIRSRPTGIPRSGFFDWIDATAKYCAQNEELLLTHLSVVDTSHAPRVMISRTSDKSPKQISQSRHCGQEGGV